MNSLNLSEVDSRYNIIFYNQSEYAVVHVFKPNHYLRNYESLGLLYPIITHIKDHSLLIS